MRASNHNPSPHAYVRPRLVHDGESLTSNLPNDGTERASYLKSSLDLPCKFPVSVIAALCLMKRSGMVYDDAEKLYAEVRQDCDLLIEEAATVLLPKSTPLSAAAVAKGSGKIIGVNTTFFPRRDIVEVPLTSAGAHLKSQMVQTSKDGTKGYALLDCSSGGHLARPTGFFADCTPVSGNQFETTRSSQG